MNWQKGGEDKSSSGTKGIMEFGDKEEGCDCR